MQPAEFLARFVEHTGDVIIFGYVALHQQCLFAERAASSSTFP